jgi:hypothetical protein
MSLLRKIDKLAFRLLDYQERNGFDKKIRKYCKKNSIDRIIRGKYLTLNKKIFENVSDINDLKDKEESMKDIDLIIARGQILNRLYELNKEFISALKNEHFNTQNALTRQIIELYLISFKINEEEDYSHVLTGNYEKNKVFPKFGKIIGELKENKSRVKKDYNIYSGSFHPKQQSFMKNLFLLPPDFCGRVIIPSDSKITEEDLCKIKRYDYAFAKPYFGNKRLFSKGWNLATLTKNSAGPNSHKILGDFMYYADEIMKLNL